MINFLMEMAVTWLHIIIGMGLMGILVCASYLLSGIHNRYIEKKDESEFEKFREAMRK